MTITYLLRQSAKDDLDETWSYTLETWGLKQADRYLYSIFDRFTWLSENPYLGKQRNDVIEGYYCFPQGMHLIFYKVINEQIEILGVPHQNMDISIRAYDWEIEEIYQN